MPLPSDSPLQWDMFTGKLRDTRTRKQKQTDAARGELQQMDMFGQREVAQFGVRARPVMDVHPGRLQLVMEDPRTPEEKERDLQREAESLTSPMFGTATVETEEVVASPVEAPASTPPAQPEKLPHRHYQEVTHHSHMAYPLLVQAAYEQAATEWIAPEYQAAHDRQLVRAVIRATQTGMVDTEIEQAMQIGRERAKAECEAQPRTTGRVESVTVTAQEESETLSDTPSRGHHGLRQQLRQSSIIVRSR